MKIKHGDKGFHLTTTTGFVLSVQYGTGNYCENYALHNFNIKGEEIPEVATVEIAIWRTDNKEFIYLGGNNVAGYVPVSLLPDIMLDLEEGDLEDAVNRIINR